MTVWSKPIPEKFHEYVLEDRLKVFKAITLMKDLLTYSASRYTVVGLGSGSGMLEKELGSLNTCDRIYLTDISYTTNMTEGNVNYVKCDVRNTRTISGLVTDGSKKIYFSFGLFYLLTENDIRNIFNLTSDSDTGFIFQVNRSDTEIGRSFLDWDRNDKPGLDIRGYSLNDIKRMFPEFDSYVLVMETPISYVLIKFPLSRMIKVGRECELPETYGKVALFVYDSPSVVFLYEIISIVKPDVIWFEDDGVRFHGYFRKNFNTVVSARYLPAHRDCLSVQKLINIPNYIKVGDKVMSLKEIDLNRDYRGDRWIC